MSCLFYIYAVTWKITDYDMRYIERKYYWTTDLVLVTLKIEK